MASQPPIQFQVDPDRRFQAAVLEAIKKTGDLTEPFILITKRWFKANRAIFTLKGPGKYTDLSPGYKLQKQKRVGFIYPILRYSGLLEASITNPDDANAINLIVNKTTLILGTKVSYAGFHQFGTKKMPARPPLLVGVANSGDDANEREIEQWKNILNLHILKHAQAFSHEK